MLQPVFLLVFLIQKKKGQKMSKTKTNQDSNKEELMMAILDFYAKHPRYRMSQGEFVGLICALSQQMLKDI
jgi:tyrosyl-tRNA synthetase